ncbi:hypothetical protein HanXRQr2_Chr06g0278041 [Helianthus annuus]|uniref:Uncharacterized protein n=1 Tax=Helianthus annuus TaxID=4232 RepID=A0A9K3NLF0_HELAN|nr:hypothetical protein HanXRQr2_Chr06g0278041 [Helianthus annuus]
MYRKVTTRDVNFGELGSPTELRWFTGFSGESGNIGSSPVTTSCLRQGSKVLAKRLWWCRDVIVVKKRWCERWGCNDHRSRVLRFIGEEVEVYSKRVRQSCSKFAEVSETRYSEIRLRMRLGSLINIRMETSITDMSRKISMF